MLAPHAYLVPYQTSMMRFSCENIRRLKAINYLRKKMFDVVLSTSLDLEPNIFCLIDDTKDVLYGE